MKKDKENNKAYAPVVAVICALTLFVSVCSAFLVASSIKPDFRDTVKENVNNFLYQEKTDDTSEPVQNPSARLMCAGNNMIYRSIYSFAASLGSQSGKDYDFAPIYEKVKSIVSQADFAMINQSTVLSDNIDVSSYPSFCSPTAVGDAIYDLGFNVINHANKNVFDKDVQGATDTLDYWATKSGALVTGLYRNETDKNTVKIKEVNGIKIAFLGFTDTVQSSLSSESEINVINLGDRDRTQAEVYNIMKDMIQTAEDQADAVVVSMYFGNVSGEVSQSQKQTVDYLVSFGADLIIGCGVSNIQPVERITRDDGTSAVVYYSLGNFVSAEEKKENMLGGIADVVFEKNGETGETIVKSATTIPIVTYYESGFTNFSVLLAENLTDEAVVSHSLNSYYGGFNVTYANETFAENFKAVANASFTPATEPSSGESGSDTSVSD